jgi:hypothetical protein
MFWPFHKRRTFDVAAQSDPRNEQFPVDPLLPPVNEPVAMKWHCPVRLDQGREGACHIEGTEVLTIDGWKDFRDLTDNDLLGTVNRQTEILEYQKPTARQCLGFDGELVISKNSNVNFAVTPNHRMLVRKWDQKKRTLDPSYSFIEAKSIGWYSGLMDAPKPFNGQELPALKIGYGKRGRVVSRSDFCRFLGIFLSEGCLYHPKNSGDYRIEIAAVKPSCRDEVYEIVSALGFTVTTYDDRYTIHSVALFEMLKDAYQKGARTKKIPRWLFTETIENRKLFINSFCLGDGHTTKDGRKFFYTSSKSLSDGIQEMLLTLGMRSSVREREPRDGMIGGRIIKKENCCVSYVISPWRKKTLSIERKRNISALPYQGKVYCATVQNGTLITRYNGTILISGNCVGFGLTHFLATGPAVLSRPTNADAFALYEDIKRNDRRPGEDYSGTWIEDGLKLLQKRGIIDEYRWPKTADEMARCLSYVGPLVVKVPIYGSFYHPNKYGMIQPCGKIKGWHCMLADEIVPGAKQIWFLNSWGSRWGKNGRCWMSYDTAGYILSHGATAAVATKTA